MKFICAPVELCLIPMGMWTPCHLHAEELRKLDNKHRVKEGKKVDYLTNFGNLPSSPMALAWKYPEHSSRKTVPQYHVHQPHFPLCWTPACSMLSAQTLGLAYLHSQIFLNLLDLIWVPSPQTLDLCERPPLTILKKKASTLSTLSPSSLNRAFYFLYSNYTNFSRTLFSILWICFCLPEQEGDLYVTYFFGSLPC